MAEPGQLSCESRSDKHTAKRSDDCAPGSHHADVTAMGQDEQPMPGSGATDLIIQGLTESDAGQQDERRSEPDAKPRDVNFRSRETDRIEGESRPNASLLGGAPGQDEVLVNQHDNQKEFGDEGYAESLIEVSVRQASDAAANGDADEYSVEAVSLDLSHIDDAVKTRLAEKVKFSEIKKSYGALSSGNADEYDTRFETAATECGKHAEALGTDKAEIESWVIEYGGAVPLVNAALRSILELAWMSKNLGVMVAASRSGVPEPRLLANALMSALADVPAIMQDRDANGANGKELEAPGLSGSVEAAAAKLRVASKDLNASYRGWRQNTRTTEMVLNSKAIQRLTVERKEIQATIETLATVGSAVDLGMAVVGAGGLKLASGATLSEVSKFGGIEAEASGADGAALGALSKLPTDASSLARAGGELWYDEEIKAIQSNINLLDDHNTVLKQLNNYDEFTQNKERFRNDTETLQLADQELRRAIVDRRMAFRKFGEQLDLHAASSPELQEVGIGTAKQGQDKYETVLAVAAQIGIIQATMKQARKVSLLSDPKSFAKAVAAKASSRQRSVAKGLEVEHFTVPDTEAEAMRAMIQTSEMLAEVERGLTCFSPVTMALRKLMVDGNAGATLDDARI